MGTRHLIAVHVDGQYKVAQYGQWDGYPEGQGKGCLEFLREQYNPEVFKTAVRACKFIDEEKMRDLMVSYGQKPDGMIAIQDYNRFSKDHPEFSRDTGSDILKIIQDSPEGLMLESALTFAADSLFCEWAYVIDLDTEMFEVYEGFNKKELTPEDRFYFLREYEDGGYHGVRLVKRWFLSNLPTEDEFDAAFGEEDD